MNVSKMQLVQLKKIMKQKMKASTIVKMKKTEKVLNSKKRFL